MERVAFLVEETGQTLRCLLNPESVVLRRQAGVRPRRSAGGDVTGARLADDPLLYTGGGRTELELDLLFDVNLAGSSLRTHDVRDLTRPLWDLAENSEGGNGYGRPPAVRFVWGKAWNIPIVVAAVAERVEQFTPSGAPQRSWLRLRLLRMGETPGTAATQPPFSAALPASTLSGSPAGARLGPEAPAGAEGAAAEAGMVYELKGTATPDGPDIVERLDELAYRFYGSPLMWRLIALANDIPNPLDLAVGLRLRIPTAGRSAP